MRSLALTAGDEPDADALRYACHVLVEPAAVASVWQMRSAPAMPPRSAPFPEPALVTKKDIGQIRIFERETKFEILREAGARLEPEVIEANINKDRAQWNKLAKGLYDTSMEALKAIDAKDAQALVDIGGRMDMACENCHMTYWYPNQPLPPTDDPRFKGITPNK